MNDPVAEALARVYSHGRVPMPPNMRKVLQSTTPTGHSADNSGADSNSVTSKNAAAHKDGVNHTAVDKSTEGSVGKKVHKGKNPTNSQGLSRAKTTSATSVFREFSRTSRVYPTGPDGHRRKNTRRYESLGSIVNREVVRRGWTEKITHGWITANWSTVAGDYLGAHSRIRMIKDTTLFLECDSTAKASELRYLQTELLSRIAQHVGPDVITAVKIFGPRPPSWRHGPLHVKGRGPRDTYG